MAAAKHPITLKEVLTLPSIGINTQFITFTHVTMESDKYICIREMAPQNSVVIVDMNMAMKPLRMLVTVDSALMHSYSRILALKAQIQGTVQDRLRIFNIELKTKMKSYKMPEQVTFWKWISPKMLGLVTQTSVYHWSLEGDPEPIKMFERTANLANSKIINYQCDPTEKWLVLIGIAPGTPERPQLVKGNMQLFSVDQQHSQAVEAHAASFAQFKVPGNENPSVLISFASKTLNDAGQVISNLHVIELGAQPGKPSFTKKQANLFFPPNFADDIPVSMLISHKYGLIYVISNQGLLFVYDLETATAVNKKAGRWKQSIILSKKDNLYKDAMETASQSGERDLAEGLLVYFIDQKMYAQLLPLALPAPPMPSMWGGFVPPPPMSGMGMPPMPHYGMPSTGSSYKHDESL